MVLVTFHRHRPRPRKDHGRSIEGNSRMKSILVPVGGAGRDDCVLETALATARPFAAHLNFLHVHVGAGQAAVHSPHADFATGPALREALADLEIEAKARTRAAEERVRDFCARSRIAIAEPGKLSDAVTASWRVEENDALRRIMFMPGITISSSPGEQQSRTGCRRISSSRCSSAAAVQS